MKLKDVAGIELAIGAVVMIMGTALFVCVSRWFAILIVVGLILMVIGESRKENEEARKKDIYVPGFVMGVTMLITGVVFAIYFLGC